MKDSTENLILKAIPFFILISLLPMMFFRDFTPSNEIRYLSIVDEMLSSGKFFAFTFNGIPYADKPPLYFWLLGLCRLIAGSHCMPLLSLLSAIPGLVILCIMDKWVREEGLFSKRERISLMLVLGSSTMFLGLLFFLRMDLLMAMFITLALYSFHRHYCGKKGAVLHSYLFPVWTFLALFTKGPVGLLMPIVTVALFIAAQKRFKEIGKWLGWKTWLILAGLSFIWLFMAYRDGGIDYIKDLLFHQTVDRAVNAFHHKKPFWYYFLAIWYVAAPWFLLMIPGLVHCIARRKSLDDTRKLFACAVFGTFIMLSGFSSKLAVYLVPIIPFLVYLQPDSSVRQKRIKGWDSISIAIPAVILAMTGLAVILLPVLSSSFQFASDLTEEYGFVRNWTVISAMIILTAGSLASAFIAIRKKDWIISSGILSCTIFAMVFCASFSMPDINPFIGYGPLAREIERIDENRGMTVETYGISRTEIMPFYTDIPIGTKWVDIDAFMADPPQNCLLVIKSNRLKRYPQMAEFVKGRKFTRCGYFLIYEIP